MLSVTFLHLDLGIGGAERLIVDAAVALKKKDCDVHIVTTHHDRSHCFSETRDGSILVTVAGDWLPRAIFGKFYALCSYIRLIYAAFYLLYFSGIKSDVVVCDQLPISVPILRFKISKIVYYCHFPDLLLSKPGSYWKRCYRLILDYVEEKTTNMADLILVNSEFTKDTFKKTFKSINRVPEVLYPSINEKVLTNLYDQCDTELEDLKLQDFTYFLSVNRFERKKNVRLAVDAFSRLQTEFGPEEKASVKLIITGGYDTLVQENISYFAELKQRVEDLNLSDSIILLKSPSEKEKIKLMKYSKAVLYTPDHEHFGIVPLEAMFCRKPVIAVNSGGPKETIQHGVTGFLCSPTSLSFSAAMFELTSNQELCDKMGQAARERFETKFSFDIFAEKLSNCIMQQL